MSFIHGLFRLGELMLEMRTKTVQTFVQISRVLHIDKVGIFHSNDISVHYSIDECTGRPERLPLTFVCFNLQLLTQTDE